MRDLAPVDGPGATALLSATLLATWRVRDRGRLTVADYLTCGGVRAVAATWTSSLTLDEVRTLNQLVRVDGCTVSRRRARLSGVLVATGDEVEICHDQVLDALTRRPVARTA